MSIEVMKRIKSLLQDTKMIDSHTISAVVAECDMIILSEQPSTGEPLGWLFQHEETGLTQVVDCQQVEWGFEANNPRWQKIRQVYDHPAPSVFLVRDIASLLGASVPDVCNALAELGYEPRRSTNAAISPDEALAVADHLRPVPSVPDEKPLPDLMMASYHEAIGWNACRAAMLAAKNPGA